MNPRKISIVVPVFNEEGNILLMVKRLKAVIESGFDSSLYEFEVIFVDDGSTDGTRAALKGLAQSDPLCKAVLLRRNFGKSAALAAGFAQAQGEIIVTMDGDLQDEPDELPRFIAKIDEGFDLVAGWKQKRNDPSEKVIASRAFNAMVSKIMKIPLRDFNCGYKAYRSWCVKEIFLTGNLYRFLPVFVHRQGGKIAELPVQHNARKWGASKYGIKRYFHGMADLVTMVLLGNFLQKPMYFFGLAALPAAGLGLAILSYLVFMHVYWLVSGEQAFQLLSRPLLSISLGLIEGGFSLLIFGGLAELMVQLIGRSHGLKLYNIEEVVQAASPTGQK